MPLIRFRERMVGPVGPVAGRPWTIRPRGEHGGDGVVRVAVTTTGARPQVLDLADLHVRVDHLDRVRDGWAATVTAGTVTAPGTAPLPVVAGFADLLTTARGGRRMHYRLLATTTDHALVVEGLKTVRGGVRPAWAATTTLHALVVRVPLSAVPADPDDLERWLGAGGVAGEVTAAGVLRVRGLVRQGLSMRGAVLPFLVGFVRRAVLVRPS